MPERLKLPNPDLSCSPVALTRTISVLIQPPFQITTPSLFTHPANSHVSLNVPPRLPQVYIDVEDVNDNYPLTSKPVYHAEVMENSEAGTPVAQVSATDRDGDGPLTYSIAAGNPQSLFAIDSETGEGAEAGLGRQLGRFCPFLLVAQDCRSKTVRQDFLCRHLVIFPGYY